MISKFVTMTTIIVIFVICFAATLWTRLVFRVLIRPTYIFAETCKQRVTRYNEESVSQLHLTGKRNASAAK